MDNTICIDYILCKHGKECKYGHVSKIRRLLNSIRDILKLKFRISLPIYNKMDKYSGTDKCPFKLARYYTCYDCTFALGDHLCMIPAEKRKPNPENDFNQHSKCGSFEFRGE